MCKDLKTKYQSNKLLDLVSDFQFIIELLMTSHCPSNAVNSTAAITLRNYSLPTQNKTVLTTYNPLTLQTDYFCNFYRFWNSTTQNERNYYTLSLSFTINLHEITLLTYFII